MALADVAGLHNAADDLPIPRLVALLEHAAGLVTVDSGPAHAAAAVGCPQVVLFGKASPSLYRPWGTAGADVKVLTGEIDGEPDMLGIDAQRHRRVDHSYSRARARLELAGSASAGAERPARDALALSLMGAPSARSMSCVTSTTPRRVTKKRSAVRNRILSDLHPVRNHAVLVHDAAGDLQRRPMVTLGSSTELSMMLPSSMRTSFDSSDCDT